MTDTEKSAHEVMGVPGPAAAGLDARLIVDRGTFRLDVALTAAPGDVVALLGPNGAGKTTALRALAGLVPLTGGHLRLDGAPLERTPPESRPVGVVFQDYLLFPHLTALDNVAFGPRCHGATKAAARARAAEWLERMGLTAHAGAKPRRLSGGQAQRVALARALATSPGCCSSTNPSPRSTPARGWRYGRNSGAIWPSSRPSPYSSPTTRWTPWCWPTASSSSRTAASSRRALPPTSHATRVRTTSPTLSA